MELTTHASHLKFIPILSGLYTRSLSRFYRDFTVLLLLASYGMGIINASTTTSIKSTRAEKRIVKQSLMASSFEIENIQPGKIFTPNGDGWNDYFKIQYANPKDGLVSGKIYNLRGNYIADMKKGANDEILLWDGKDAQGNTASGGVYIYQIEITGPESKIINGSCVLAK